MQRYTSAKTSRNQVPALHKALLRAGIWRRRDKNADLGGGKWDKATDFLFEHGVINLVVDKYNRSETHNAWTWGVIKRGVTTVTVANVLNVIAEPTHRAEVIRMAAGVGGTAYFTVYEGNRSGKGRRTRDGWQENRKLVTYLSEIEPHFVRAQVEKIGGLRVIVAGV